MASDETTSTETGGAGLVEEGRTPLQVMQIRLERMVLTKKKSAQVLEVGGALTEEEVPVEEEDLAVVEDQEESASLNVEVEAIGRK